MTDQNPACHGTTSSVGHVPDVRFDPIANTSGPPHQKCTNVKSATRLDPMLPTLGKILSDGTPSDDQREARFTAGRSNFVFMFADDLGYRDLACYGHRCAKTLTLDKLASEGTRFTQAYASIRGTGSIARQCVGGSPDTDPSRSARRIHVLRMLIGSTSGCHLCRKLMVRDSVKSLLEEATRKNSDGISQTRQT